MEGNLGVKYVAFFDNRKDKNQKRLSILAATNIIEYISSVLGESGKKVSIISPSWTTNPRGFYKSETYVLNESTEVKLFATFGAKTKVTKVLSRYFSLVSLLFYLLLNTEQNETVLLYHSPALIGVIKAVKRVKRIRLLLEVEEIYGDVSGRQRERKREIRFFRCADAYIFPTVLMNELINTSSKPYLIMHGTYKAEPDRDCKFNDGKIHCVYAGTFDPRKGGATAAVTAAEYLDSNYHIHIIGFGSGEDKSNLLNMINDISKTTECILTFDGLLSGEDYIRFIQSCDIGLSTQNPHAEYNDTSFPSKVLSYLANGLRGVSIRIKVLETSTINDLLNYYEENTPQAIASAIKSVDIKEAYDSRNRIRELDKKFVKELTCFLEEN